jgi:hypothetical protein
MEFDEEEPEATIEDTVVTLACLLLLRQSPLDLEELFFLHEAIGEKIKVYERDIH